MQLPKVGYLVLMSYAPSLLVNVSGIPKDYLSSGYSCIPCDSPGLLPLPSAWLRPASSCVAEVINLPRLPLNTLTPLVSGYVI